MKNNSLAFLVFLGIVSLLLLPSLGIVNAQLGCSVIDTTSGTCVGATVFKMASVANNHSEIPGLNPSYNYGVCCQIPQTLGNSCAASNKATVLKLSAQTNAHVQVPSVNTYANDVCLSAPSNLNLMCNYQAACDAGYACLATISANTDAQVGDCSTEPYATKVCCKCDGTVSGIVMDANNQPIDGAQVDLYQGENLKYTAFTQPSGTYTRSNVLCGTYNAVASAPEYASQTISDINLPTEDGTAVNFGGEGGSGGALVLGSTCEPDCTYVEDDTIHGECDNINGCSFENPLSKNACNFAKVGWIRYYDGASDIKCIPDPDNSGKIGPLMTRTAFPAEITCEDENIVKITKVAVYKGKPVKMVIVVCG